MNIQELREKAGEALRARAGRVLSEGPKQQVIDAVQDAMRKVEEAEKRRLQCVAAADKAQADAHRAAGELADAERGVENAAQALEAAITKAGA